MKTIHTNKAPQAVGPYSQAMKSGNLIFCSGQIGLIPETMELIEGGVEKEALQIINNIIAVLEEAGATLSDVVKTTIFLDNINDFKLVNDIYSQYFTHRPARSTIEVAKLPLGAKVEIEVIAEL